LKWALAGFAPGWWETRGHYLVHLPSSVFGCPPGQRVSENWNLTGLLAFRPRCIGQSTLELPFKPAMLLANLLKVAQKSLKEGRHL